jgi:hypothetical protein
MISSQAQQSISQMVVRAIQASPLVQGDALRTVELVPDLGQVSSTQAAVLTVSSYVFRLTFLLHFADDAPTRQHFAAVARTSAEDFSQQAFMDAIRECGNICCGNLNRDLVRVFPHLGMSTPNLLDRRCADYLGKLGAGHVQHFALLDGGGPQFVVTVCVNAFAELDFTADLAEEETTGELEMF